MRNQVKKFLEIVQCLINKHKTTHDVSKLTSIVSILKCSYIIEESDENYLTKLISDLDWLYQSKESSIINKGLLNLGNSNCKNFYFLLIIFYLLACYMNSVLQALYMTQEFRNSVLKIDFNGLNLNQEGKNNEQYKNFKKISSAYQLQKLFALMYQSKRGAINPSFFRNVLPEFFRNSLSQQDASEFFKIYIDSFESSIRDSSNPVILPFFLNYFSFSINLIKLSI